MRELTIAAGPETVWEFLVDPEKADTLDGHERRSSARPGGEYRATVLPGDTWRSAGSSRSTGPAGSCSPGAGSRAMRRAREWRRRPGRSTIEIDLEPDGDGTHLRFVHRDLPTAEATAAHAHGWDHYLARLVIAALGGDPGRDTWLDREM